MKDLEFRCAASSRFSEEFIAVCLQHPVRVPLIRPVVEWPCVLPRRPPGIRVVVKKVEFMIGSQAAESVLQSLVDLGVEPVEVGNLDGGWSDRHDVSGNASYSALGQRGRE